MHVVVAKLIKRSLCQLFLLAYQWNSVFKDGVLHFASSWEANFFALTDNGFGFYQPNPSQLEKFSMSAAGFAQLSCALELKEGMRPAEVVVEEPLPVKEEENADQTEKTEEPAKTEEPEEKK